MDCAASVARALRGVRNGEGWLCRCPVPSHGKGKGDRNPSLSVRNGNTRLLVKCFAGCTSDAVLGTLRQMNLVEAQCPPAGPCADRGQRGVTLPEPHRPDAQALAMWRSAEPAADTRAQAYLHARGIALNPPPTLRFLTEVAGWPTMIAAVQAPDRQIVAAQLTHLTHDGRAKAPLSIPRRTVGALGTGAVRLGMAGEDLGIAEGVEDALAATQLCGLPCWACLGAGRMHRVNIPTTVKTLHIFADDDEPGRRAAQQTSQTHVALGRRVLIRRPPAGMKDWGEMVQRLSPERIAA